MIPYRKRWGQNFLVHAATAERIADAARLTPSDTVIEVGPGDGALTRPLLARAGRILAIEIDPLRAEALAAELAAEPRFRLLAGDALDRSFSEWLAEGGWDPPAVLVANLPYNVATPILVSAIADTGIRRSVATVQKEVAQRFAARPGSEHYGYLSVRAAAFAKTRILFDLPPGAFRPRPKVISSVFELVPRDEALPAVPRDRALALASLAFQMRRKTLPNALAAAGGREIWEAALDRLGKDRRARAEELSLEDFLALAAAAPAPESPHAGRTEL
ncbi:MAG: 16S rRNA (adenine(1518)-N(6)/adenine(1519)-N(6))-dimethyltransferase RsmA [Acidobacteriota bacterium]